MQKPKSAKDRLFLKSFESKSYDTSDLYMIDKSFLFGHNKVYYKSIQDCRKFYMCIEEGNKIKCLVKVLNGITYGGPEYLDHNYDCITVEEARRYFHVHGFNIKRKNR